MSRLSRALHGLLRSNNIAPGASIFLVMAFLDRIGHGQMFTKNNPLVLSKYG